MKGPWQRRSLKTNFGILAGGASRAVHYSAIRPSLSPLLVKEHDVGLHWQGIVISTRQNRKSKAVCVNQGTHGHERPLSHRIVFAGYLPGPGTAGLVACSCQQPRTADIHETGERERQRNLSGTNHGAELNHEKPRMRTTQPRALTACSNERGVQHPVPSGRIAMTAPPKQLTPSI